MGPATCLKNESSEIIEHEMGHARQSQDELYRPIQRAELSQLELINDRLIGPTAEAVLSWLLWPTDGSKSKRTQHTHLLMTYSILSSLPPAAHFVRLDREGR